MLTISVLVSLTLFFLESGWNLSGFDSDEFETNLREHGFSEEKIRQILPVSCKYTRPFLLYEQMFGFLLAFN